MICSTEGKEEAVGITTRLNPVDYGTISGSRRTKRDLLCINAIQHVDID